MRAMRAQRSVGHYIGGGGGGGGCAAAPNTLVVLTRWPLNARELEIACGDARRKHVDVAAATDWLAAHVVLRIHRAGAAAARATLDRSRRGSSPQSPFAVRHVIVADIGRCCSVMAGKTCMKLPRSRCRENGVCTSISINTQPLCTTNVCSPHGIT